MQNEKDVKVNKIDMPENPPLAELKAVKLADYYNLAAIRAKILQIKEAVTNNLNSGFHHTRPVCCSNYTVPKSNCSHFFVCSSLGHAKSVCPHRNLNPKKKNKKKRVEVAQERHHVTHSNKPSSEKCCVCKKSDTTL